MPLAAPRDPAAASALVPPPTPSWTAAALLPDHEAYARVFQPARELGVRITWRSLAGASMHAGMQWSDVRRIAPHAHDISPEMGTVDPETAAALVEVLGPRTTAARRCVFLVWEGYAGLAGVARAASTVAVGPLRRIMHVLEGSLEDALENLDEPPSVRLPLWWLPEDRAWSVGADLYARSVLVGGTTETIRAVLTHPRLEALPVPPDHEIEAEDD